MNKTKDKKKLIYPGWFCLYCKKTCKCFILVSRWDSRYRSNIITKVLSIKPGYWLAMPVLKNIKLQSTYLPLPLGYTYLFRAENMLCSCRVWHSRWEIQILSLFNMEQLAYWSESVAMETAGRPRTDDCSCNF